jgi:hypothetical protein
MKNESTFILGMHIIFVVTIITNNIDYKHGQHAFLKANMLW